MSTEEAKKTTSRIFNDERERILCLSFKEGGRDNESFKYSDIEVVDIINDYPWILDNVQGKGVDTHISSMQVGYGNKATSVGGGYIKKTKVPVCYLVERKNAVNGSIVTLISLLGALDQIANGVRDLGQKLEGAIGNNVVGNGMNAVGGIAGDMISGFKAFMQKIVGTVFPKLRALEETNNLNDEILNPYRFLYFTEDTKKRYVFPLSNTEAASFMPQKLQWEDAKIMDAKSGMGKLVNGVIDFLRGGAKIMNMINNVASLTDEGGRSDDTGYAEEMAKTFKYPKTGDALKVEFTLYNTTRKNAWKNNYRFLLLLALRNLPFRLELFSYVPPLLYDITIPGIKRMPISALTNLKVTPVGTMRVLTMDNFIASKISDDGLNEKIQVAVPEAWQIQLTFQSLISPSANLLLAPLLGNLGITASSTLGKPGPMTAMEREALAEQLSKSDIGILEDKCRNIRRSLEADAAFKQLDIVRAIGATDELLRLAQDAWRAGSTPAQLDTGVKIILQTFGKNATEDEYAHVTPESVLEAAKLLYQNNYAIRNENWYDDYYQEDSEVIMGGYNGALKYLKRQVNGLFELYVPPKILSDGEIRNFVRAAIQYGIPGYSNYDAAMDNLVKEGAQTLLSGTDKYSREAWGVSQTDVIVHLYSTYRKRDGSNITPADVSYFIGTGKQHLNGYWNAMEWNRLKTSPPEYYYNAEERAEVLQEINSYNEAQATLEKEAAEAADKEGEEAPSKTPRICDDLIPKNNQ